MKRKKKEIWRKEQTTEFQSEIDKRREKITHIVCSSLLVIFIIITILVLLSTGTKT